MKETNKIACSVFDKCFRGSICVLSPSSSQEFTPTGIETKIATAGLEINCKDFIEFPKTAYSDLEYEINSGTESWLKARNKGYATRGHVSVMLMTSTEGFVAATPNVISLYIGDKEASSEDRISFREAIKEILLRKKITIIDPTDIMDKVALAMAVGSKGKSWTDPYSGYPVYRQEGFTKIL